MKPIACVLTLALVASISAFATVRTQQPAKHFHAHILSHAATYSYKAGKAVANEASKPIFYAGKQVF